MKHSLEFLPLILIFSLTQTIIGQQIENESTKEVQSKWLKAIRESQSLENFYSQDSGIMIDDELFLGLSEINKSISTLIMRKAQLKSYQITKVYQLRNYQKFVLGVYETENGLSLSSIIGWKYKNNWTKEFEVIYTNSACSINNKKLIDNARENWEKHSNSHRPDLIVEKIFSKEGKYYTRGNLFIGKEIIDGYSYMANESYKINLESLKLLQVNCNIVYDIGTFEVGGKGLYILIWKKESEEWKLLLDFNF